MTHLSDDDLVLLHYREDAGADAFAHLAGCAECTERLRALGRILAVAAPPEAPERGDDYGARVWERLRPQLGVPEPRPNVVPVRSRLLPRAASFLALAAALALAFLLGRRFPDQPQPLSAEVRERVLLVAVGDHLERSQMVLVELVNAPAGEADEREGPARVSRTSSSRPIASTARRRRGRASRRSPPSSRSSSGCWSRWPRGRTPSRRATSRSSRSASSRGGCCSGFVSSGRRSASARRSSRGPRRPRRKGKRNCHSRSCSSSPRSRPLPRRAPRRAPRPFPRRPRSSGSCSRCPRTTTSSKARDEDRKEREDDLYDEGTEALDEGAWDRAVSSFRSVTEMKGRRADAALYWRAYAESKQGRSDAAQAAIEELRQSYPQSRWLKEAKALELEMRQRAGQPPRPENVADEDLKLMALNGLMNSDPEQAIPLLEKFLQGNQSRKLQERALFVLCQSSSPRAREIVVRIAKGESQPELQRKAIQSLGVFGGKDSRQALAEIYASSSDASVKKAVLQAFMVSGEKGRVLEAARTEKDPSLRRQAIQLLGVMGAREELWAMYQAETVLETKKAVLQALAVGGDTDRIVEMAKSDKDVEMRLAAMRALGPFGGPSKAGAIVEIYRTETDRRIREAALGALFVSGSATALIEIAKTEKDPELKKKAVSQLANMHSKEATAFLLEILNQ